MRYFLTPGQMKTSNFFSFAFSIFLYEKDKKIIIGREPNYESFLHVSRKFAGKILSNCCYSKMTGSWAIIPKKIFFQISEIWKNITNIIRNSKSLWFTMNKPYKVIYQIKANFWKLKLHSFCLNKIKKQQQQWFHYFVQFWNCWWRKE